MQQPTTSEAVKEVHADLCQKYKRHSQNIQNFWRSFSESRRVRCIKDGMADGVLLKHSMDRSPDLRFNYQAVPEWNLHDLSKKPDHLLDMLEHRATKTLCEQYLYGSRDGPGDFEVVAESMRTKNLRYAYPTPKDSYTLFMDNEQYGFSFQINSHHADTLAQLAPAIEAKACIPQSIGELVLYRQITLMSCLGVIIDDILEHGSQSRSKKPRPKQSDATAASTALSSPTIQDKPPKLTLSELLANARDQVVSLEQYLDLLTEPVVLAHDVNFWFFSRPELVPDEKGRMLPVHTGKYVSAAVFDAIHNSVKGAAVWDYIGQLLERLQGADKASRSILLQELSNACHLEYTRAQNIFKRHVQTSTGAKWFKRLSNALDSAGNARVTLKGKPEDLTRSDPQLHYMLRLCQADMTAMKAVDWLKKLSDLHEAHSDEREKLHEREAQSLGDLAVIVSFIRDVSTAVSLPSPSRKLGQLFVSRSHSLDVELDRLKKDSDLDLRDFAVPIDNLLEPGMTESALESLAQFIVDKTGTKLGFLYQDLVNDCFSALQAQFEQTKAETEQAADWSSFPAQQASELYEKLVEQRRQKEKTRPSHSSAYDVDPSRKTVEKEPAPSVDETFKVSAATAEVFANLFKKSEARAPINWTAFQSAMADLGFSVLPKYGSVYTFVPPKKMADQKPFTVHRPHKSEIEGYTSLIFARRLRRTYGWRSETFEVV